VISLFQTLAFTATSTLTFLGIGFQRPIFAFHWVPDFSSASGNSLHRLNRGNFLNNCNCQRNIYARFEVFAAVTMENVVFWDITTQFLSHRRHITSPLHSPAGYCYVKFEVFTAVTMKNVVFWDIKTQFVHHRRDITSPLHSPAGYCYVRFQVFTAATMKNVVFWDIKIQSVAQPPSSTHLSWILFYCFLSHTVSSSSQFLLIFI
jgi:hypothetical protein